MQKKVYYHISRKDLGENPTLKAKIPESAIASMEGTENRVCFCPDIIGCLLSIAAYSTATMMDAVLELIINMSLKDDTVNNPTIYSTDEKLIKPPQISDFKLTKEMWSLKDISVQRIGYINVRDCLFNNNALIITSKRTSKLTEQELTILKMMWLRNKKMLKNYDNLNYT